MPKSVPSLSRVSYLERLRALGLEPPEIYHIIENVLTTRAVAVERCTLLV